MPGVRKILGLSALLGVLTAAVVLPVGPAAAADTKVPGPVVLIGTGGLRWDDVTDDTPSLQTLLATGSVGTLAVRSVRPTTCPADGWLAVSAGRRAGDLADAALKPGAVTVCRDLSLVVPTAGGPASVPRWSDYVTQAGRDSFDATPGLLGQALAQAGKTSVAVGPGAALALGSRDGEVAHAFAGKVDGAAGNVDPTSLFDDVRTALTLDPDLLVVDAGAIRDPLEWTTTSGAPGPSGSYKLPRAEQVQRLDDRLGLILGSMPDDATVVLASTSDSGTTSQLRLLAASGPSVTGGTYTDSLLGTRSTRQDGMAQTTDLLPTLLDGLGVPVPVDAVGSPLQPVDAESGGDAAAGRLEKVLDLDKAARAVTPIVPWFFNGLVIAQILLYGIATLALRRGASDPTNPVTSVTRTKVLRAVRRLAVVFASVPAATFLANLVPWWRSSVPGVSVTAAVIIFSAPIAAVALLGPWRNHLLGPMGVVGAITALVLAGDVATGSHLMLSSLMGVQPVVAGRFYGFSNPGFGLFATGCLLAAIAVAHAARTLGRRWFAVGLVVAIGLFCLVVDGTPGLGSDFGGPPAIVPAFAVLAILVGGWRVTWRRAVLIALATVGVLVLIGVADWLRPAQDRTHLGRFVQTVIDGGAWSVVERKGAQNLRILTTSFLSALVPFAVAFVVFVLARPLKSGVRPLQLAYDRSLVLRHGLIATGILFFIGFALNDSGVTIPVVSATVALPLLIATSVRALELDDAERLEKAVSAVRR